MIGVLALGKKLHGDFRNRKKKRRTKEKKQESDVALVQFYDVYRSRKASSTLSVLVGGLKWKSIGAIFEQKLN